MKTCGEAARYRKVFCVDESKQVQSSTHCDASKRPPEMESCGLPPCEYIWITGEWSEVSPHPCLQPQAGTWPRCPPPSSCCPPHWDIATRAGLHGLTSSCWFVSVCNFPAGQRGEGLQEMAKVLKREHQCARSPGCYQEALFFQSTSHPAGTLLYSVLFRSTMLYSIPGFCFALFRSIHGFCSMLFMSSVLFYSWSWFYSISSLVSFCSRHCMQRHTVPRV